MTIASTSSGWSKPRRSFKEKFNIRSDPRLEAHFDVELRGLRLFLTQTGSAACQGGGRGKIERHLDDFGFGDIVAFAQLAHEARDVRQRALEISRLSGELQAEYR